MKAVLKVVLIMVFGCLVTLVQAEELTILKVYGSRLVIYSEDRQDKQIIDANMISPGTPVLEYDLSGYVKVRHEGRPVWLRANAVQLSQPQRGPCPDKAPGRPADTKAPAVSGLGGDCS